MHPTEKDRLLTLDECCARTGESISTWRIRVQRKEIPFIRFGTIKGVRVKSSDLEAFINSRAVKPAKVVSIG